MKFVCLNCEKYMAFQKVEAPEEGRARPGVSDQEHHALTGPRVGLWHPQSVAYGVWPARPHLVVGRRAMIGDGDARSEDGHGREAEPVTDELSWIIEFNERYKSFVYRV